MVLELMDGDPSAPVALQDVLTRLKMTSGILYYHFADFPSLLEEAMVEMYLQLLYVGTQGILKAIGISDSATSFEENLRSVTDAAHRAGDAKLRSARAWIAAQATLRPSLGAKIAKAQEASNHELAEIIRKGQEKGLVRVEIDPLVVAVFLQAYQLGRIVDDLAGGQMDNENWKSFVRLMISQTIISTEPKH